MNLFITLYLIAVQFAVRSNSTPDCLQFCRPCVAKPASLSHTDFSLYNVSATLKNGAYILCSSLQAVHTRRHSDKNILWKFHVFFFLILIILPFLPGNRCILINLLIDCVKCLVWRMVTNN